MKKFLMSLLSLWAGISTLFAQIDIREAIRQNPDMGGSIYTSYHYDTTGDAPAPEGYKPFFISHFGRHGSRWHTSSKIYDTTYEIFEKAAESNALTDLGKDVFCRVKLLRDDAAGREGQLSPKGTVEHRGIAERMFAAYPEVFSTADGACRIEARSTLVPRCMMSMASFCERLKELNPEIEITRSVGERYLPDMANFDNLNDVRKSARKISNKFAEEHFDPSRLIASLFDVDYAAVNVDCGAVAQNLYMLAADVQDVDYLGITLFDIFTEEELFALWECSNVARYMGMGPSADFGDALENDAKPLLRHIITDADETIASGNRAAFLRFAHDINVVPLVSLLQVEGKHTRVASDDLANLYKYWCDSYISPMATNVQFIFFRSESDDVILVKVLHNETPCHLPLSKDLFPYYRWEEFKSYYLPRTEIR